MEYEQVTVKHASQVSMEYCRWFSNAHNQYHSTIQERYGNQTNNFKGFPLTLNGVLASRSANLEQYVKQTSKFNLVRCRGGLGGRMGDKKVDVQSVFVS